MRVLTKLRVARPTMQDNQLVFYLPDPAEWQEAVWES